MKEKQNISEMDWTLVGKYLNGEATPMEAEKVEKWSSQSDENLAELNESRKMLDKIDSYYQAKKFNSAAAWQNVRSTSDLEQPKTVKLKQARKIFISRFYKYAAVIIVAVILASTGYYFGFRNTGENVFAEIVSPEKQVVSEYVLPDGTVVALNSNSKLVFPKKFDNHVREVTITGEAFFDVTPNPEKPFIIHAGNAQIKVLGTSFNVRAYPENEMVEVVVESGKVQVKAETAEKTVSEKQPELVLSRGEKGLIFNQSRLPEKMVNTDRNFLAWKTQNLIFSETPLSEVVDYLEKVYHIKIQLKDKELNDLPLTATFNKKPVEFVLNVIQLTFNLELTADDDLFILSGQKNDEVKH